jgi:EmrB/QacA subfamily drug resistance transporter
VTVVALAEAAAEETFGGKASSLARAIGAGLPVPDGLALSWEMVAEIANGDPAAEIAIATAIALDERFARVAVRSSAIGEDSLDASFAGQHATVLNVQSEEELLEAVRIVYASARTESALAYRSRMGVSGEPRIAVVVQQMIEADVAGVLFTRDPMTGADERVIESAWGLGEAVVSGVVTPDRFRISADGTIVERIAARKELAIRFAPDGGTREEPLSEEDSQRLTLTEAHLLALHDLAAKCEAFFSGPQDIEWAIAADELFLLQSRPVSTQLANGSSQLSALSSQENHSDDRGELAALSSQENDSDDRGELAALSSQENDGDDRGELAARSSQENGDDGGRSCELPAESCELMALTPRRFTGLALAALLAPLNSTIIAVALPSIVMTFDSSAAIVTRWLVTGYLVVSIIAQSPAGKLADLWGASRVLTLGRTLFGAGALLAALSPNLAFLGAGRVLMALGGAFSIPTVFAQLRRSVPYAKRGRIFGIFGAVMGGAAAVGPIVGGFLTTRYGWHSVFLVNVPVVLLSFLLEPPARRADEAPPRTSRFDFAGSALLGIAVLLLVTAVERASIVFAIGTLAALVAFVIRERSASDPVLDVALFRNRPFAAGGSIVALQNLAMYAMLFLLPFFLAQSGNAPSRTGRMLLCFTAAMVLASPIGGRLSDAIGARIVAVSGALIATSGAALFVASGDTSLIASLVLMGTGIGISTSPSQASALSAVPASQAGVASGALSTLRYVGGVIGSGLVALLAGGGLAHDARWIVFPAVLLLSAAVAFLLPAAE